MGAKAIDLSGKVFGRLTSNHRHGTLNGQATWHCTCSCGNKTIVRSSSLTNGNCSPKAVCISAGGHILIHNGIDRLDPEVGYTELNSLPSCSKCNYMKGSLSEGEFLTQIKEIVKFKGEM